MKKILSFLRRVLPHIILVLSLMMITFFVIDLFNPAMAFLSGTMTKTLLAFYSFLAMILALLFLFEEEKKF